MNEPEKTLRAAPLTGPSAKHLRRMDALFRARARESQRRRRLVWASGIISFAAAALIAVVLHAPAPEPPAREQPQQVYCIIGYSPANTDTRADGFLTDPGAVQLTVYTVREEKAPHTTGDL